MCDPISAAVGVVGGAVASKVLAPKAPSSAAAPAADPAAERAAAEAEAQQSANRRLAEDQRRRRGQGSLLSNGATTPTLGDTGADPGMAASPLGGAVSRGRVNTGTRTTLMSSSAAASAARSVGGGGGGGGGLRTSVAAF